MAYEIGKAQRNIQSVATTGYTPGKASKNAGGNATPKIVQPEEQDGFLKTLVKSPVKSLLVKPAYRAAQALVAAPVYAFGGEESKAKMDRILSQDQKFKTPLGTYDIEAAKPGVAGAKQVAGEALEAGSYLIGGGGVSAAAKRAVGIAKGAIKPTALGKAVGGFARRSAQKVAENADNATYLQGNMPKASRVAGTVLQGKTPKEQIMGARTLGKIDTSGVKTYSDLVGVLDKNIKEKVSLVDTAFKSKNVPVKMSGLKTQVVADYSGRKLKASVNHVEDAVSQLSELYKKTHNVSEQLRLKALSAKAASEGLTPFEINGIAREYGSVFKAKGFNKFGQPLTNVNEQMFENTRKGIKEVARSFMPDDQTRLLDKELTELMQTKKLTAKMAENVLKLQQRVQDRGLVEKAFRGAAQVADVATFGGPRAFVTKFLFPSNVGLKTMNALDLQKHLVKNLKILKQLNASSDAFLSSKITKAAQQSGLVKASTTLGTKVPLR
jgi:hypothetical protein